MVRPETEIEKTHVRNNIQSAAEARSWEDICKEFKSHCW